MRRRTLQLAVFTLAVASATVDLAAQGGRTYPSATHGGNPHVQFLLPAGSELHTMGSGVVSRWQLDRRRDERLHLEGGS